MGKLRVKLISIPWELEVPTLALASLAAVTPESHFEVCIVDLLRERLVLDEPTDLVGISASTPSIYVAYALADLYRRMGVKVVMGGHHVTAMPEEGLQHADAVVCGEGEGSWARILEQMLANPSEVSGVYADPAPDLATLPQPRVDLMKIHRYQPYYYPVVASRGCPMACSFCFAKRMTLGYRTYPISHVMEQIRRRPSWVKAFYFVDDNLAGDVEYTRELFRNLKQVGVQFGMQVRHEFCQDEENLRLAREAGCGLISSGFESVNQQTLDKTGKRANASLYKEIVTNIQREGIIASANWMFGFDWDTKDVFQETWEFLRESQVLHCSFTTEIPFPGTPIYKRYLREGRLLSTNYDDFVGKDRVVVKPAGMTPQELQKGIRWLTLKYYSVRHRRHLARVAAKNANFLPGFQGWTRQPILDFLNYFQIFLYRYRMVPSLRWLYFRLLPFNKYRFLGDLFRGTNFWGTDFPYAEGSCYDPVGEPSPYFTGAGAMRPGGKELVLCAESPNPTRIPAAVP
jgi:radical SAM superfamily enzyme YgiQ (UPF0313 family)